MSTTIPHQTGVKQKLTHELRELLAISTYLAVFFLVFKFYTRLVLEEYGIDYFGYGLIVIKAILLAKIILMADMLRVGGRFQDKPLIVPTLYNTIAFSVFTLIFEILEHIVTGTVRGKHVSEVFAEILDKGWPHLAGTTMVVFVAFLPFFAFRELERVLTETRIKDLFLKPRASAKGRDR